MKKKDVFDRLENIVEKEEMVSISNFSFSHNVFRVVKDRHCIVKG